MRLERVMTNTEELRKYIWPKQKNSIVAAEELMKPREIEPLAAIGLYS
jgi:hypothetical protein